MKKFFSFPNPVNDAAARTVALGVVTMGTIAFFTSWSWIMIPLTYGFAARVAFCPGGTLAIFAAFLFMLRWVEIGVCLHDLCLCPFPCLPAS